MSTDCAMVTALAKTFQRCNYQNFEAIKAQVPTLDFSHSNSQRQCESYLECVRIKFYLLAVKWSLYKKIPQWSCQCTVAVVDPSDLGPSNIENSLVFPRETIRRNLCVLRCPWMGRSTISQRTPCYWQTFKKFGWFYFFERFFNIFKSSLPI